MWIYPSFLSVEEGKEVGVWPVDGRWGPERGGQELAAKAKISRLASRFPLPCG